jgi:hypothetical protein
MERRDTDRTLTLLRGRAVALTSMSLSFEKGCLALQKDSVAYQNAVTGARFVNLIDCHGDLMVLIHSDGVCPRPAGGDPGNVLWRFCGKCDGGCDGGARLQTRGGGL